MSHALIIATHGSHLSAAASVPAQAHAAAIRQLGIFDEVRVGSWKEEPSLARAFDGLPSGRITVVPFFMAEGYFTSVVIPREMRLEGPVSMVDGHEVRTGMPVGMHPRMAAVVAERAREAGAGTTTQVVLLGHGTLKHPGSRGTVEALAGRLVREGRFGAVVPAFIDDEPRLESVAAGRGDIVVVPYFVAEGWHVGATITATVPGVVYTAPAGTHPDIARVIMDIAEECDRWGA